MYLKHKYMKFNRYYICSFMSLVVLCNSAYGIQSDTQKFNIPKIGNIVIDGRVGDWKDNGFRIEILTDKYGEFRSENDFDAQARLAWDERGLLVLVEVTDDIAKEYYYDRHLFKGDSIELFVATGPGSEDRYELVISPGIDPKYGQMLRHCFFDKREDRQEPLSFEAIGIKNKNGYTLEVLLPWSNMRLKPDVGKEMALQLYVIDSDKDGETFTAMWHHRGETHRDTRGMYRIRLAERPSRAVDTTVGVVFVENEGIIVNVAGVSRQSISRAEVRENNETIVSGQLINYGRRSAVQFKIPLPKIGVPLSKYDVFVDNRFISQFNPESGLPGIVRRRAKSLKEFQVEFQQYVFNETQLPSLVANKSILESVIGPFELQVKTYDSDYNLVENADSYGRYGAVVEIIFADGRISRRFKTLFRSDIPIESLPGKLKEHPAISALRDSNWPFENGAVNSQDLAVLLAGMDEIESEENYFDRMADVWATDRQWWVGLKRKIYDMEKKYPDPFVAPLEIKGEPAPVLREGTPEEAGMKSDVAEKLGDIFRELSMKYNNETLAVIIARNGVIFFKGEYGNVGDKKMTVNTKCDAASQTKILSAILLAMLVDQGIVSFDDSVTKYVLPFNNYESAKDLTIRHCMTHTHGLGGHWGDEHNDFEELIAPYYPALEIGRWDYSGTGHALVGKIIELISGEAIPQFYKRHLIDPLGLKNTDVTNTHNNAQISAYDASVIAQLLLNGGAYGELKLFSKKTLNQMLPKGHILTGIGFQYKGHDGLSNSTFGHDGKNSGMIRIDPVNNLILVIESTGSHKTFNKHYASLYQTIMDGIVADRDDLLDF